MNKAHCSYHLDKVASANVYGNFVLGYHLASCIDCIRQGNHYLVLLLSTLQLK